ncbi:hypothetical protein GCAAIG_00375 [Candidatus Electronema halotolerans]
MQGSYEIIHWHARLLEDACQSASLEFPMIWDNAA